jgi:formate hydrogenlyase transcriptional activator
MRSDPSPAVDTSVATYCALLQVTEAIASHHDLAALFHDLAQRLPQVLPFSYIAMILHDPDRNVMRVQILEAPHPQHIKAGLVPRASNRSAWFR